MRRLPPMLAAWALATALSVVSATRSLENYREFRSAWAWDLAYNNQWFWALVFGDRTLSVCPINSWGDEGPPIWVRTHLDPIRLAFVPIYALAPGPETLIVIHNVILWWLVPAAFSLVRSESGSDALALLGAALVPLTPLLWPLAWNDFREMELALPFVLWAIQGYRRRRAGLAALGIGAMLLCREEFGVVVASLAILPPRDEEEIGRTYRWSRAVFGLGIGWVVFAFFGYEYFFVGSTAPRQYLAHFGGPKASLFETSETALDLLAFGLGSWALLALLAPRVAVLSLPWIVGMSSGRWALRHLADVNWHHVRYTTPAVALVLAAGLLGFVRLAGWVLARRGGRPVLAVLWVAIAAGLLLAGADLDARMARIPRPFSPAEAAEVRRWVARVGPEDGVVAAYEVTPQLSSRRLLYSNVMSQNMPRGYPQLRPEIRWAFLRESTLDPAILTEQGFEVVSRGDFLWIYRRVRTP